MLLIYIFLYVVILITCFFSKQQTSQFLSKYKSIGDNRTLIEFKLMVRNNMYSALGLIVLWPICLIMGLLLLVEYKFPILVLILLLNGTIYFVSKQLKPLEAQVRNLECASPELAHNYRKVCEVWVNKLLPNF